MLIATMVPQSPDAILITIRLAGLPRPARRYGVTEKVADFCHPHSATVADMIDESLIRVARIEFRTYLHLFVDEGFKIRKREQTAPGGPASRIETAGATFTQETRAHWTGLVNLIEHGIIVNEIEIEGFGGAGEGGKIGQHHLACIEIKEALERPPEGSVAPEPGRAVGRMAKLEPFSDRLEPGKAVVFEDGEVEPPGKVSDGGAIRVERNESEGNIRICGAQAGEERHGPGQHGVIGREDDAECQLLYLMECQ